MPKSKSKKKTLRKQLKKQPRFGSALFYSITAVTILIIILLIYKTNQKSKIQSPPPEYNPQINPTDFTKNITNKYFTLSVGKVMNYGLQTDEGTEKTVIEIIDTGKSIMGVNTITYWDRVWLDTNGDAFFSNNEIIEETYDYLAQDTQGNVWYFGEDVDNFENGVLTDHSGSWIAGENGALPGIWIKGDHKVGDSYRQEYLAGEAEDMRDVVAVGIDVRTENEVYKDCVQFYDWSPLDPDAREFKFYCAEPAAMVLSQHLDENKNPLDSSELLGIEFKE